MANYQLGSGFISVFPEMKGFKKSITGEMGAAGREGGRKFAKAADDAGHRAGRGLGSSLSSAFDKSTGALGGTALAKLDANVKRAEASVKKAANTQQTAAEKVTVAEKRLAEVREAVGDKAVAAAKKAGVAEADLEKVRADALAKSSKVAKAEADLSKAKRDEAAAAETLKAKEEALARAKGVLKKASDEAVAAAKRESSAFGRLGAALDNALARFKSTRFGATLSADLSSVGSMFSKIGSLIGKTPLGPVFSSAFAGVKSAASAAGAAVTGAFSKAWAALPSGVKSAASSVGSAVANMAGGLASRVSGGLASLTSTFSSAFQGIAGAAAAAGAAIAGGIVSHLGAAAQRVDTLNNFPRVMQNLGFSADEASASIRQLVEYFDSGLPGTLDGMASSVQSFTPILKGMGYDLEQTTTFTTALNDALLASGKGEQVAASGMEQYSQMLATGKADLQSWKILMQAMPGQMDQLASSMLGAGKSGYDLQAALNDGTVTFDELNAAIIRLDKEGGEGFASFRQQAIDATGGIVTSVGKIGTGFAKAGEKILTAIGPEKIADAANKIKVTIEDIGAKIGELITKAQNAGGEGGLGAMFKSAIPALGTFITVIQPLLTHLPRLGGIFEAVGGAASKLTGPLAGIVSKIPMFGGALSKLLGPAGAVIGLLVNMWQNSEPLQQAVSKLGAVVSSLAGKFSGGGGLGTALQTVSDAVGRVAGVLGDALAGVIENVIIPLIPRVVQIIQTVVPPLSRIVSAVAEVIAWLVGKLSPVITAAIGWFANIAASVASFAAGFISKIVGAISKVIGFFANFRANVSAVMSAVGSAVSAGISRVVSFFTSLPGKIRGALAGAGSWLVSVGRNMVNGLISGIGNFAGRVYDKLKSGIDAAINKAKSFLGIASPSKYMAEQVGRWLPAGVTAGVDKATPAMVRDVGRDLSKVSEIPFNVPVNYATRARFADAATPNSGARGGVVQNVYVRAADPMSTLAVLEARQRTRLGA